MSERTFFDMRYIFPGFMFYIGILLWSQFLNLEFFKWEIGSGIISSVGLPLIGFLFSQIWYIPFLIYRFTFRKFRNSSTYLNDHEYQSNNGIRYIITNLGNSESHLPNIWRNNIRLLHMRDYIYHYNLSLKRNKDIDLNYIRTYLTRRWDLINTIGSGAMSYFLGLIFGSLYISIVQVENFIFFKLTVHYTELSIKYYDLIILFSILIIISSLMGMWWINDERQDFLIRIFNQTGVNIEDLSDIFPDIIFENIEIHQ